jgi:hypothetical protein
MVTLNVRTLSCPAHKASVAAQITGRAVRMRTVFNGPLAFAADAVRPESQRVQNRLGTRRLTSTLSCGQRNTSKRHASGVEAARMRKKNKQPLRRKVVLRLPDLDHAKSAVLNTLSPLSSRRNYKLAMDQFITW